MRAWQGQRQRVHVQRAQDEHCWRLNMGKRVVTDKSDGSYRAHTRRASCLGLRPARVPDDVRACVLIWRETNSERMGTHGVFLSHYPRVH